MFPTLYKNFQKVFNKSKPSFQQSIEPLVDRQLQSEFAQSIQEGMVVTRSQEHAQPLQELQSSSGNEFLMVQVRKRNAPEDPNSSPTTERSKRRRTIIEPEGVARSIDSPQQNHCIAEDQPHLDEDEKDCKIDSSDIHSLEATTEKLNAVLVRQTTPLEDTKKTSLSEPWLSPGNESNGANTKEKTNDTITNAHATPIQDMGEAKVEENEASNSIANTSQESVSCEPNHAESTDAVAKLPKATHKKFGSEDTNIDRSRPEPDKTINLDGDPISEIAFEGSNSYESENEGPETVTAAAGFEQSRLVTVEALRVVERQQAVLKSRRKERDNLLKAQAKSAKKTRHEENHSQAQSPSLDTISESVTMTGCEPPKQVKRTNRTPLPALLPKELLEEEPVNRLPTPPMKIATLKPSANDKLRLLNTKTKAPKDIRRGSLSIRVLESDRSLLPPKASSSSKLLRETWLAGRRGTSFVPRKRLSGGFVRK